MTGSTLPAAPDLQRSCPGSRASRRYVVLLASIVSVALVIRVLYVMKVGPDSLIGLDSSMFYRTVASRLISGDGFTTGTVYPDTGHPPLFVYLLAALDLVGLRSVQDQRLALAVLGSAGLILVAETGRRFRDPLTGLLAASIGALSPLWFGHQHALMPESLVLILGPALLLSALWCLEEPSSKRWALIGVLSGFSILTRSDLALLVALLGLVLAFASKKRETFRLHHLAVMVGIAAVMVAPWLAYHRLEADSWKLSTNGGVTLAGANCQETYFSPGSLGSFSMACGPGQLVPLLGEGNGSTGATEADTILSRRAVDYARAHPRRLPVVALARLGRTWMPYESSQTDELARVEGRSPTWEGRALPVHLFIGIIAIGGVLVSLRDRRLRALVMLTPIISVSILSILFFGSPRARALAQPSVAVFAGAMISSALHQRRRSDSVSDTALEGSASGSTGNRHLAD